MAIKDVISDWNLTTAANTTVIIRPASGDEWIITHMSGVIENHDLYFQAADVSMFSQYHTAETSGDHETQLAAYAAKGSRGRLVVTNSEYFSIHNNNSSTSYFVYSAIKNKD